MRTRPTWILVVPLVALTLVPSPASAQNAEIAGVVRDSSGAVLPGATVEASSPALIERSRTVFTDSQGQYRIIALNAGEYKVTFTLTGFGTVVRERIVLTAAFTATVDASMTIGALAESVTVSGQSPLVDVQTTTQRRALTSELLGELPTGRSFQNFAILVPGVQMPLTYSDVGGSDGARWQTLKVHGSRDDQMPLLMNGMPFNNMNNTGGGYNHTLAINTGTVQEMTVSTSGTTAEVKTSGVVANSVAKEGGNRFTYYFYGDFSGTSMQSSNLDQTLRDQGLTALNRVKELRELNPTMGGPIVKDRLWFYIGYRDLVSTKYLANSFDTRDPFAPQYCNQPAGCMYGGKLVPDSRDLTRQDFSGDTFHRSYTGNVTWQADQKNKFNFFYHLGRRNLLNDSAVTQTPEATSYLYSAPDYLAQASWMNPVTSKFLLEGGATFFNETWWWLQRPGFGIDTGQDLLNANGPGAQITKYELSIPALYGANFVNERAFSHQYNFRFAANYVTGSHAFKVGMQDMFGTRQFTYDQNNSQFWLLYAGTPIGIQQYAYPYADTEHLKAALGVYAQDKWTIKNITLNYGLRFDYQNAYVPPQTTPNIPFVASQTYAGLSNVPNWKDINPRVGFAWDISGKGRSVLRFNYGRFVASESTATATANNPVNTRINSVFRTWSDTNGNFSPECNLASPLANGECGAESAPLGSPNIVTHWDPAVLNGWGVRPSDNEVLVGMQHQLMNRLMLDFQWTRHSFGNLFATQYLATPPSAFDSYCVMAPKDSKLPGGGGNQVCGFADVKPAFFGVTPNNFVTAASKLGNVTDLYTGFDVTLTARFPNGGQASGGVSSGRERTDYCNIAGIAQIGSNTDSSAGKIFLDNYLGNNINNSGPSASAYPSSLYCSVTPPYQPDWKALVTYPLPWGLNVSATWQNRAGPQILASQAASISSPTLNRDLSAPAATVDFIAPGTQFDPRLNQVDLRLAKSVKVGNARIQVTGSAFNLLNTNTALTINTQYGTDWLQPTQVLQGRLFKIGVQLNY